MSAMAADLQAALKRDIAQIRFLLSGNPAIGYSRMVEIGRDVGSRYGVELIVNFPKEGRIEQYEMYGRRDLSIIVNKEARRFPIPRDRVKSTACEMIQDATTEDAYMYEGKEGARVRIGEGRIDILPHSLHIWTILEGGVMKYCDWLMKNVYLMK